MRKTLSARACKIHRLAGVALGLWIGLAGSGTAHADFHVNVRRDKVELQDGTTLECQVLMETQRGVLVVVKDPENEKSVCQKLIPAGKVKKITRGLDEGQIKGIKTDPELARKVVQGSGYRKEADLAPKPPVNPTGPVTPAQPYAPPAVNPPPPGPQPVSNSKLSPQDVAEAYLSRYPALREAAELFLGGSTQVAPLFQRAKEGDATVREPLEGFLNLFLKSRGATPPTDRDPRAPPKPVPPSKLTKPPPPAPQKPPPPAAKEPKG